MNSTMFALTAHGLLLLHANPGVSLRVTVAQGIARPIIDGAASPVLAATFADPATLDRCTRRTLGHEWRVGWLVTPQAGAIIVPELGLTWTTSQLDFNADGTYSGDDTAQWLALYDAQSPLCDFTADGQVNDDDLRAFIIATEAARPDWSYRLDVNRSGWVNADDADLWVSWFVWGDHRADFNSDGWVTGEDADEFSWAFQTGESHGQHDGR